ncbi:MAG: TonB-dependent receptor plug domain-containing protein [Bacteroidales bacterium]|nr:TonB-dependent receptor plug domain-containing protein [Bacteroidales bacterium]
MKKIVISALMLLFALSSSLYAQERTITGKVTDASDGSPLPGVNIAVVGTSQGTITDLDGNYSLKVPDNNASLSFSFLGYETKTVQVGNQTVINVALNTSDVALEDVVVTALGISKEKKALGYSVTEVSGDEITKVKETNVVNSLAGRIAGVTLTQSTGGVGAGTRVIIRGNNSLTGNNQPLYVVDGIPIDNSGFGSADGSTTANYKRSDFGTGISDLNPDDIESISVLKGPNAAALYGSRAANGVVLITTKKGRKTKGLGVNFSSQAVWENPLLLPAFQDEYGQGTLGDTPTDLATLRANGSSWGANGRSKSFILEWRNKTF